MNNRFTESLLKLEKRAFEDLKDVFREIDEVAYINQQKVLLAMQKNRLSDSHFTYASGYGYSDIGRDTLEAIYADVFCSEDAIVRPQIVSGTHALSLTLFANLNKGDELVSLSGSPYDTLLGVIGVRKTKGSLIEMGVDYKEIPLINEEKMDIDKIKNILSKNTKMCMIQRSKGYSTRKSFTVSEIAEVIKVVKGISKNIIIMVDNCYGEFVECDEPSQFGADVTVGSLIKNPGGGLAPVGGYVVGTSEIIENVAVRLTAPGLGKEVGATLGISQTLLQGLFLAPSVTRNALKTAIFASYIFEKIGYKVTPKPFEKRSDIVQAILFNDENPLIAFCEGIQASSPVDSFVTPKPWDMPGYDNQVIMAAGAFVQGSSIELSADAPIRPPYVAYFQGGLTFEHGRYAILNSIQKMIDDEVVTIK
ncbi:MAG: aminotransferase class I/II-fold pyridoxal phosphate-dependent enzyme [Lachnospirales bacterium]